MTTRTARRRPRAWLRLALCLLCLTWPVVADDVVLPIPLQMQLMLKVASYDKNMKQRAGDSLRVAVLFKPSDADSRRSGTQALKELSTADDVLDLPVKLLTASYSDGHELGQMIQTEGVAILYVTPGFSESEIDAMAQALDGISVLSAGALAKYTSRGVVLGFDLVGGKPKLLVNLGLARRQHVELSSSVLKLMRVVE
jgi:hypothetical protein